MYIDHVGINTNDMEAAIPILSRMCADCCSGLSAAHSSAYAADIQQELDEWECSTGEVL